MAILDLSWAPLSICSEQEWFRMLDSSVAKRQDMLRISSFVFVNHLALCDLFQRMGVVMVRTDGKNILTNQFFPLKDTIVSK